MHETKHAHRSLRSHAMPMVMKLLDECSFPKPILDIDDERIQSDVKITLFLELTAIFHAALVSSMKGLINHKETQYAVEACLNPSEALKCLSYLECRKWQRHRVLSDLEKKYCRDRICIKDQSEETEATSCDFEALGDGDVYFMKGESHLKNIWKSLDDEWRKLVEAYESAQAFFKAMKVNDARANHPHGGMLREEDFKEYLINADIGFNKKIKYTQYLRQDADWWIGYIQFASKLLADECNKRGHDLIIRMTNWIGIVEEHEVQSRISTLELGRTAARSATGLVLEEVMKRYKECGCWHAKDDGVDKKINISETTLNSRRQILRNNDEEVDDWVFALLMKSGRKAEEYKDTKELDSPMDSARTRLYWVLCRNSIDEVCFTNPNRNDQYTDCDAYREFMALERTLIESWPDDAREARLIHVSRKFIQRHPESFEVNKPFYYEKPV